MTQHIPSTADRIKTPQAWEELECPSEADSAAWAFMETQFRFHPSVREEHWPGIGEPYPSITYAIGHAYDMTQAQFIDMELDLCRKTMAAFQACTPPGQRLYALDWQHPCYWLYPHRKFEADNPEAWRVPAFPNGDYYIFLAEDFRFGIFGHPWEQTMCVFGNELLGAFELHTPSLFTQVVRKNGQGYRTTDATLKA